MTADSSPESVAPRTLVSDGGLEILKWIALVLMTISHVNKYLFDDSLPGLMELGRPAMPIFGAVLGYNLARPNALSSGVYRRTLIRLLAWGAVATVPYIALGAVLGGWWPLNVLFTLGTATAVLWMAERGGFVGWSAAFAVFLIGGALVEFWWPGLLVVIGSWQFSRRPNLFRFAVVTACVAFLVVVNANFWALASIPVIAACRCIKREARPGIRWLYAYYPLHLSVLAIVNSRL